MKSNETIVESKTTVENPRETTNCCPECAGDVFTESNELVCQECGLVIAENKIDRGPEWRSFDDNDRNDKSRVGSPVTNMLHDNGLSTNIDWKNKDAYGQSLSANQRQRMSRLRTWNKRFKTQDSSERNLKQALGEIQRMSSALGLPSHVEETASVIYRRALEENLLPGRSIEGIATASLYAAALQVNVPRSMDEVADVSRVERKEFTRGYRYILRELNLEIEPTSPLEYIPRYASDLGLDDDTEQFARKLLEVAERTGVQSGKSRVGLAGASLYAASKVIPGNNVTQREVSEVTDMSEVTIRNRYRELLEVYQNEME